MICASVTLSQDVPPLDRVEMEAEGAGAWDFPIESVTIDVDGLRQPKTQVEVSVKNANNGILLVVNKTRLTWDEGSELTACWPDPAAPP